jgi:hypothetical protein
VPLNLLDGRQLALEIIDEVRIRSVSVDVSAPDPGDTLKLVIALATALVAAVFTHVAAATNLRERAREELEVAKSLPESCAGLRDKLEALACADLKDYVATECTPWWKRAATRDLPGLLVWIALGVGVWLGLVLPGRPDRSFRVWYWIIVGALSVILHMGLAFLLRRGWERDGAAETEDKAR